jgi:transposase-like protein
MVRTHPSTPAERAQWTAYMLAHRGEYGLITRLSRDIGVSRPTLYAWRTQAQQALIQTFTPSPALSLPSTDQRRQILTAWILHASSRGIQTAMRELARQGLSLATITAVLAEAQQRALAWMHTHVPVTLRALALDEIYANDRRGAYLNVVDVHSGAVWDRAVGDDGAALQAAYRAVTPELPFQGDQWHSLHNWSIHLARLERHLRTLEAQTAVVERQAARLAQGQRARGRHPKTDVVAHRQEVAQAQRVVAGVRIVSEELRQLLEVVVLGQHGLLCAQQRQRELQAAMALLAELVEQALPLQQRSLQRLQTQVSASLPRLLTFVPQVDQVQHDLAVVLSAEAQALLGWAWLHRRELRWSSRDIVAAIPESWRAAARVLVAAWDDAVRVSSAVERWHSIMRPHLAVHRTLSSGMLALLAVWHNHRVFSRGVHKGKSPLHLSGMEDAPSDWLVALGYGLAQETPAVTVAEIAQAA